MRKAPSCLLRCLLNLWPGTAMNGFRHGQISCLNNSMNQPINHGERDVVENRTKNLRASMPPWLKHFLLWLLPLSFLTISFFFPLSKILALTFNVNTLTTDNLQLAFRVLAFTFYQATLSTFLTLLLGLPSAYLFARYDFHGKAFLRALTAVPFMLPTVVVASSFSAIFGARGLFSLTLALAPVEGVLPFLQDSSILHPSPFMLILLAHVFYNSTIIIRVVGNALSSLDPKIEQAARSLGAD